MEWWNQASAAPEATAPPLEVRTRAGQQNLPPGPAYLVGRDPEAGIVIPDACVSWQHAVLNVLSVLSWVSFPDIGANSAAKAAERSLTNALRVELAPQGTRVSSQHVGYMDTDLAARVTDPKSDPADIARIALDGIAAGETEIVADEISKQVLAALSAGVRGLYPQVA